MIKDRIWTLVSRKLSGEATALELFEIDELIKNQANSDLYLQAIHEFWSAKPEKDEEFLEATFHIHLTRLKEKGFDLESNKEKEEDEDHGFYLHDNSVAPGKRLPRKIFYASAFLVLIIITSFFFYSTSGTKAVSPDSDNIESIVTTKSGSRSRVQLPDGSSVWLNGGSKLIYTNKDFGGNLRQVKLSGEAFFDVVKNPQKPFVIHTNNVEIRVLGTAFNVKAYPGEKHTEASLIRGSIEVTLKGRLEKIMMKPNDKLILNNEEIVPVESVKSLKLPHAAKKSFMSLSHVTFSDDDNLIVETAWVDNKLIFDNEPFEDVAVKMERWYGVAITFTNENLRSMHMTGTFEKETVTEALSALQLLSPFHYTIKNDAITIIK